MKIVFISRATGSISSGDFSVFDIICSKDHKIVHDTAGNALARLFILLPMETK